VATAPEDTDLDMARDDGQRAADDGAAAADGGEAAPAPDVAEESTPARERRNIRNLSRYTVWQGVIAAVIATFIPVFAVRAGASTFEVGLMTSLPALVAVALSIPVAPWVVRQPNLVRLVCVTVAGVWACSVAMTLLPSLLAGDAGAYVPEGIIALSAVSAVFASVSNPAWVAVVADAISRERRPAVNGRRWALMSVVGAATTLGAGWYLEAIPFPHNYQSLVIGAVVLGALGILYLDQLRPLSASGSGAVRAAESAWQSLLRLPRAFRGQSTFVRYLASTFVCRLGIALPAALYPIFWVNELDASDGFIGLRAMASQLTLVLGYTLWGRIAGKKGYQRVLIACGIGVGFYPALTGFVPSPIWLIPVAVVWGFFAGGIDVSFFEGLIDVIPADERVTYSAINMTFANLSILVGPLLGIALVEVIGLRATFLVAGALCLAGAALYTVLARPRTRGDVRDAGRPGLRDLRRRLRAG
jgi:MFS family permease